jgi:mannose-6-phosphate isomerase
MTAGALPAVVRLDGVIRRYAWGSTTAIQQLLGVEVDGQPAAELWFGAHPDDPAMVPERGVTLDDAIAQDPVGVLGADVVEQFGPRLPFLLKVLAAAKPLSIQVHPTLEQARDGYARDNAAGLAADAPQRNYRDANHKPELLCALTPFSALCGFRPVAQTLELLDALALPGLIPIAELLRRRDGLRLAFSALLRDADPATLAYAVADAAPRLSGRWAGPARAVALAAAEFPGDIGVVLSLLLNYVELGPGEAIYLGAGNVHAYLEGTGVEIMANSDNVLRCGLTPKHIDVDELLRITDFSELAEPRYLGEDDGPAGGAADGFGTDFVVGVPDFRLLTLDLDAYKGSLASALLGPTIVLCTSGRSTVSLDGTSVDLAPGQAAFLAAQDLPAERGERPRTIYGVDGTGTSFAATVGQLPAVE